MLQHLELDPAARKKALWSRVLVMVGLALAGLPAFAWLLGRWVKWPEVLTAVAGWLTLSCLAVGFVLVIRGVVVAVKAVGAKAQDDLLLPGAEEDFRWVDYFASADPVSNGPLGSESRQGPSPCNEVLNRASVLTDHNGYLRNQDEFMSKLINDLVAVAYSQDANNPASWLVPHQLLEVVQQRRRRLLRVLIAGRWATLVVGILVWLQNYKEILGFRLGRHLPSAILEANMGDPVVRLAPAGFVMFAFYIGVVLLWRFWESRLAERFFDREQADHESGTGGPQPREPRHLVSQTS